ncbi:hypothetical protein BH10CHL1_BH10CHL1_33750 [soil metagenome]
MNRQLVLLSGFLSVVFLGFLQTYAGVLGADRSALSAAQVSPLISPLISPLSTTVGNTVQATASVTAPVSIAVATVTNGSPISLVLVAAVLVGVIVVIGLVIWRQR